MRAPSTFRRGISICLLGLPATVFAQLTLSLSATDHNGYNISCFGGKDGSIDLTVSGGTTPYTYSWSNGATTQDISGVRAGYYAVTVTDAASHTGNINITLTEPSALVPDIDVYKFPNDYSVSCFECYNGNLQTVVTGGVSPYSYDWDDGATTADRINLGAKAYSLEVTDANGCTVKAPTVYLQQPDRNDWTMSGNAGTDPSSQYIGTSDSKDVVFKSNGAERLRLKADGKVVLWGGGTQTKGPLYVDSTGVLKRYTNDIEVFGPCVHEPEEIWQSTGNLFANDTLLCLGQPRPLIGTRSYSSLTVITNDQDRMIITPDGKVGIGASPPAVSAYRLFVEDGIATRDVLVKTGTWPDYVFAKDYPLMPLDELRSYLKRWDHLPDMPSAQEVADKQGVEVGDLQAKLLKTVEEQALYILQLQEKMQGMEERLEQLEGQHR